MRNEIFIFFAALVGGALLGVLFDFFRAFRVKVKSGKISIAVQDTFFWLVSSAVIFTLIFYINGAQIRWYIFAGLFFGALVYNATVSRLVVKFILLLWKIILYIILFFIKPFVKIAKWLKKPFFIVIMPYRRAKAKVLGEIRKIKKFLKLY